MIAFSLFTHGWMVWRGYLEDGPLWAAGYLLLFVYAEAYWAYRSLIADGVTPFFICNALCAAVVDCVALRPPALRRHVMVDQVDRLDADDVGTGGPGVVKRWPAGPGCVRSSRSAPAWSGRRCRATPWRAVRCLHRGGRARSRCRRPWAWLRASRPSASPASLRLKFLSRSLLPASSAAGEPPMACPALRTVTCLSSGSWTRFFAVADHQLRVGFDDLSAACRGG